MVSKKHISFILKDYPTWFMPENKRILGGGLYQVEITTFMLHLDPLVFSLDKARAEPLTVYLAEFMQLWGMDIDSHVSVCALDSDLPEGYYTYFKNRFTLGLLRVMPNGRRLEVSIPNCMLNPSEGWTKMLEDPWYKVRELLLSYLEDLLDLEIEYMEKTAVKTIELETVLGKNFLQ